jgi:hypothetical protein
VTKFETGGGDAPEAVRQRIAGTRPDIGLWMQQPVVRKVAGERTRRGAGPTGTA